MRILFNTSSYFGDAVVSSGLLAHLLERHPSARVTIACGHRAAPLFTEVPGLERLISVRKRKHHLHWADIWFPCAPYIWDIILDVKGSALAYLLLARQRLSFRPRHAQGGERTAEMAGLLGLAELPAPRVWTGRRHQEAAERLLPGDGPILALGPTASWPLKVWPPARFAELARRLTAPGAILEAARIVVLGAPGEENTLTPLLEALPPGRLVDLVGKTDLLTAAAVLERCSLFVGNDSGPLYLSVAAGIPGIGLMGPSPGLFGPARPPYPAPWARKTALVRTPIPLEELTARTTQAMQRGESLMESLSVDAVERAGLTLWERCRTPSPVRIATG